MHIFRRIFLSKYWWQNSDISLQASYRYPISWEAFFDPSDSYFLFGDLVGFYTHLTYMHIFRRIFLSNYWWQESDIWSQASYKYAILWEVFFDPSDSYFLLADLVGFYTHWKYMREYHKWALAHSSSCFFFFILTTVCALFPFEIFKLFYYFHLVTHCSLFFFFLSFYFWSLFSLSFVFSLILWFMTADYSFGIIKLVSFFVCFVTHCFLFSSFFFWSLFSLSFNLRLLITHLVSSNFSCTYIFVCTYLTTYSLFYICCIYKDVTWFFDLVTHYELIYIIIYISYHIDIFYLVFVIQFFHVFWIKTSLL